MSKTMPADRVEKDTSRWGYWLAIVGASLTLLAGIGMAARLAGLGLADLESGAQGLVLAQVALLTVLLWPSASIAIRRLYDRRTAGWGCAMLYAATVFAVMLAYFGKPVQLFAAHGPFMLMPATMLVVLVAWLAVEMSLGDTTERDAPSALPSAAR